MERGAIRPGPIGIGVDATTMRACWRRRHARSAPLRVGPLTRGLWWEIIAVPDIRVQLARVADALTAPQEPT
jgi:uncharacterized NAD(P)/FAD-binding protein YdhS